MSPVEEQLIRAIRAKERCTKLYSAAFRRHKGPTPEKFRAVYVARGNAVRDLAQQC